MTKCIVPTNPTEAACKDLLYAKSEEPSNSME
eukprot:CAMPEP_0169283394 /NCGR_PEP_ID=MMETSP1016-20121227/57522_1 /TAXON_ID=342587 /ORGANISM="Karlodinium micrum, Strain CCMP2283" /LENGTH=31 /DNA_ID= /DNA_START= /DNA_END= /DNA_ORIENTATION=